MKMYLKRAFTLIELMVVIAILATIMGVLMSGVFGASESANKAKCMSNMQGLYKAVTGVAMKSGYYPPAQSYEYMDYNDLDAYYCQYQGWIGWNSRDAYGNTGKASSAKASSSWRITLAGDELDVYTVITNGALWKATNGNIDLYTCPTHVSEARSKRYTPGWSYVMNSAFRYDRAGDNTPGERYLRRFESVPSPSRFLMFAEIPFIDHGKQKAISPTSAPGNSQTDTVLQYDDGIWPGAKERIGFNHIVSERDTVGHVCFADGHVESIHYPSQDSNLDDLTRWLCEGIEISYSGGRYKNASEDD